MIFAILFAAPALGGEWRQLPSLPDREGFAGSFAGVSGGALIVAGGSNFPDAKPWAGGKKVWYDSIFVLDRPDGKWTRAGRLPRPLAYGVSAVYRDAMICVGGSDADRHHADAFRLTWKQRKIVITPLPPLPKPIANACGAVVGHRLYIAGGQESPDAKTALRSLFAMDLDAPAPAWRELEPCPGNGRILATAAAYDGAFWFIGGAERVAGKDRQIQRRYLKDVWRYDPGRGWRRMSDLPHPIAAAPSPAPVDGRGILVLGGDDGSQVGVAPERHSGFSKQILRFDAKTETWSIAGEIPAPRVTTPCVRWNNAWIIPGGEARPGIRSPEVWSFAE